MVCDHVVEVFRLARAIGPNPADWDTDLEVLSKLVLWLSAAGFSGSVEVVTSGPHQTFVVWDNLKDPATGVVTKVPVGVAELKVTNLTARWPAAITDDVWNPENPTQRVVVPGRCIVVDPGVQGDDRRTGSQLCTDVVNYTEVQITAFINACDWPMLAP